MLTSNWDIVNGTEVWVDKAVTLSRVLCGHSKTLFGGESPVQLHCVISVKKRSSEELERYGVQHHEARMGRHTATARRQGSPRAKKTTALYRLKGKQLSTKAMPSALKNSSCKKKLCLEDLEHHPCGWKTGIAHLAADGSVCNIPRPVQRNCIERHRTTGII